MGTKLHTEASSVFLLDFVLITGDKKRSESFVIYLRHDELICQDYCVLL